MKQKLFTLFMLLVAIVTGAQAASYIPTTTNTISTNTLILPKDLAGTETWVTIPSKTLTDKRLNPTEWDTDFGETQPSDNVKCLQVKTDGNTYKSSKRVIHMLVTGITGVKAIGQANSGRGFQIGATEYVSGTTDENTTMTIVAGSSSAENPVSYTGLDASKTYIISILAYSGDTYLYGIYFTAAPQLPKITTQPQSAAYSTGQTIDPLIVVAEASAGTLTYQWYKNTTNEAVVDTDHAIDGATSDTYTPTEAGFYYVVVTDANGSVTSDVAEITISAAEAPTISVSGAPTGDVIVGTEVILTAEATGVPTPTITWYDGSDAEVGTGETYTVPTDVAGTFTFYAKASNSAGDATSATQTIVVKEQVVTPTITPNGAYFEESQEVTIECTDADATIKYSTDNGATWTDYTAALTFTATTTLQAKAVKDGSIDSEIATATFNKVTLVDQTDVTAAATWDWSKFGTKEIKLTAETTPSKTTFFVLQNAVSYGLCSSISSEFGDATQLNVQTEYVVRDSKYFQGGFVKFKTTVPGTVSVTYSNTGTRSNESDRRFLNVNGKNYGDGTMGTKDAEIVTTTTDVLASGEITIKGTLKGDGSDQYLRIYTITFTPLSDETTLILDEKGGNATKVSAAVGEGKTVFVDRTLSPNYYNTLYLPFAMSAAQITTAFGEGAQVATFTGTASNGTTFNFSNVTGMAAHKAYLVKPAATVNGFTVEGATIVEKPTIITPSVMGDNYSFDGTLDSYTYKGTAGTPTAVYYFTTSGTVKKLATNGTIKGLRAYMRSTSAISSGSGGGGRAPEEFFISFGDDVTAINAIDGVPVLDANAPLYNLAGQRVGQSYKGVVIQNGKKFVIK